MQIVENAQEGVLTELFNQTGEIEWRSPTSAWFTVDGREYRAMFGQWSDGYEFTFKSVRYQRDHHTSEIKPVFSHETTADAGRSAIKVFSAVVGILEEFINRERPKMIHFTGHASEGKPNLYKRMAKALATRISALGYTVSVVDGPNITKFLIAAKPK